MTSALQHRDLASWQDHLHALDAGAVDRRAVAAEQQQRRMPQARTRSGRSS